MLYVSVVLFMSFLVSNVYFNVCYKEQNYIFSVVMFVVIDACLVWLYVAELLRRPSILRGGKNNKTGDFC